jgi:hypothetical protein
MKTIKAATLKNAAIIMNKEYQKNAASKAKYLSSFDKFTNQLLNTHLLKNKSFSKSQKEIAQELGTSIVTVERHYKRLREDPRYFVSKPKRTKGSKLFLPVTISFSYKYKSCLSEYEGEEGLSIYIKPPSYISTFTFTSTYKSPIRKRVKNLWRKKDVIVKRLKKVRSLVMKPLPELKNLIVHEDGMETLPEFKHIIVGEHGFQKLRVYPNKALIHADECLKFAKPYDPVKFFCSVAYKYCLEHKITPQWQIWFDYKEKHNLSENLPFLKLKVSQPQKREMRSMSSPKRVDQSALFKKLQPVYEPREIAERKLYAQDLDPKFIALLGPDLAERCRKSQLERCSF